MTATPQPPSVRDLPPAEYEAAKRRIESDLLRTRHAARDAGDLAAAAARFNKKETTDER